MPQILVKFEDISGKLNLGRIDCRYCYNRLFMKKHYNMKIPPNQNPEDTLQEHSSTTIQANIKGLQFA